jgi:hypothetical protein
VVSGKIGSSGSGVGVEFSSSLFILPPAPALELEQPAIAVIAPAPASAPAFCRTDRRPRVLFECCASVEVLLEFMIGMDEIDREQRLRHLSDLPRSPSGPDTHAVLTKGLTGVHDE